MMRSSLLRWIAATMLLVAIFGFSNQGSHSAHASSCDGYYCHYHLFGNSGSGADGTGGEIVIPNTMYDMSPSSGNAVAFMVWMWGSNNTGYQSSIETGMVYGSSSGCGTFESYFHPYATKDDGGTERDDCGYIARGGQTMILWSYHPSGGSNALSQVDVPGTNIWSTGWGSYTDWAGFDNQSWAEAYGQQGQPTPYWSLNTSFQSLQWENGSGNWGMWGYVSITNDCPYHGAGISNYAWQPKGYSCNGGQP